MLAEANQGLGLRDLRDFHPKLQMHLDLHGWGPRDESDAWRDEKSYETLMYTSKCDEMIFEITIV